MPEGRGLHIVIGFWIALLMAVPAQSLGQQSVPPRRDARFLVDVNFGMADSLAKDREFRSRFTTFGEVGVSSASYPAPSRRATLVDIGGSFRVAPAYAVGVSYNRTFFEDVVGLSATIPHPTFHVSPASNTGGSGNLTRTEGATNIFLAVTPIRRPALEWRISGGPTIFSLRADMVDEVLFAQAFDPLSPQQTITITGVTTSEVSRTTYGVHIGSDLGYFFTDMLGVAGGFRYSYGTVTVNQEPLSLLRQQIRVGNTQFFGGLRFRFGR
jgi:hypothetical protein